MKKQITTLLEKPMGRKEFLQNAGVGVLMLFGGGLVTQALTGTNGNRKSAAAGYGGDAYGGAKRG